MVYRFASRSEWCPIIAFAWMNPAILDNLRKDPKSTIEQLASSENSDVAAAAQTIVNAAMDSLSEDYSGYLPLPNCPDGLETLDKEALENLIGSGGISGILQCDRYPKEWANILKFAWSKSNPDPDPDPDNLNLTNIRQDPLKYLPEQDKNTLLESKYGILPIPDRPKGLDSLSMEQLTAFLSDRDATEYITGIWLMGS